MDNPSVDGRALAELQANCARQCPLRPAVPALRDEHLALKQRLMPSWSPLRRGVRGSVA